MCWWDDGDFISSDFKERFLCLLAFALAFPKAVVVSVPVMPAATPLPALISTSEESICTRNGPIGEKGFSSSFNIKTMSVYSPVIELTILPVAKCLNRNAFPEIGRKWRIWVFFFGFAGSARTQVASSCTPMPKFISTVYSSFTGNGALGPKCARTMRYRSRVRVDVFP